MITVIAFLKEMLMEYSKGKIQGAVVGRVQIVSRRKKIRSGEAHPLPSMIGPIEPLCDRRNEAPS